MQASIATLVTFQCQEAATWGENLDTRSALDRIFLTMIWREDNIAVSYRKKMSLLFFYFGGLVVHY
jgi:hypothetical protein